MSDSMQRIKELTATIENEAVRSWKEGGGKVFGYACVATPPEIIEAAGVLPYRIRALGNPDTDIADSHLSRFNCSFCRSCLQLGLDGTYDFLDGLIETNGCDHLRGMFENWQYVKPVPFFHYLKVPHLVDEGAVEYFVEEIALYRDAIGEASGKEISDEDLRGAIASQEKVRASLRDMYESRKVAEPPFTGEEALALVLLSSSVSSDEFLELCAAAVDERKGSGIGDYNARLLLIGAATDEPMLVHEMESLGGLVVSDAMCYGSRAFWTPIDTGADPVRAIASMYLEQLLCPRMYEDFPRRLQYVKDAIEEWNVDGVIAVHNKFCDVHGVDNVQMRLALEKEGMPVLTLEKEYGSAADAGRIRTRVQAFLERIGGRR